MPDFVSKLLAKSTAAIRFVLSKESTTPRMLWSLYDLRGRRKYLVPNERIAFLRAALQVGGKTASFCAVLALSGARISEVLALTAERIDEANGAINLDTLKRRRRGVTRAIPVPHNLLLYLDSVHHYREAQQNPILANARLWSWSRTTAWRRVHQVMRLAANPTFLSKPKSLRHAFGAEAALNGVPLTLIKKWMGHARIETTEIYTALVGKEERALARLVWRKSAPIFRGEKRHTPPTLMGPDTANASREWKVRTPKK